MFKTWRLRSCSCHTFIGAMSLFISETNFRKLSKRWNPKEVSTRSRLMSYGIFLAVKANGTLLNIIRQQYCSIFSKLFLWKDKFRGFLSYGTVSPLLWIRDILLRIRILLFSSVADKMPTKNDLFSKFSAYYIFKENFFIIFIILQR